MQSKWKIPCLLAIFCTGCGLMPPKPKQMYPGPALPFEQVAVISQGLGGGMHVSEIDGVYVVNPAVGAAPPTKGLHVMPGPHKVKAKYLNLDNFDSSGIATFAKSEQEIIVDTKAGHTYVLRGSRKGSVFVFWLEDKGVGYNQECLTPENYQKVFVEGQTVMGC